MGIMGCGKSTIGKYLAKRLNFPFIDTDDIIVRQNNMSISELFSKYGETKFRSIEKNVIRDVSNLSGAIQDVGNWTLCQPAGVVGLDVGMHRAVLHHRESSRGIQAVSEMGFIRFGPACTRIGLCCCGSVPYFDKPFRCRSDGPGCTLPSAGAWDPPRRRRCSAPPGSAGTAPRRPPAALARRGA